MFMLIAAVGVSIWCLIFLGGLLFRKRRLPYLFYSLFSFLMAAFIWDGYQLAQYKNDSILLAVLVGVSAILGLVMFLIGEVTWENLDYPFGLPDGEQSKPKWQKLLSILSILFLGWLLVVLLL